VFRVAGGQRDVPIDVELKAVSGFVTITTNHPEAAIAIDGKPIAYQRYDGPVEPGSHVLQVYKEGYDPFEQRFEIAAGEKRTFSANLNGDIDIDAGEAPNGNARRGPIRGWYGLLSLNLLGLADTPTDFTIDRDRESAGGATIGIRAGYRIFTALAPELLLEGGSMIAENVCVKDDEISKYPQLAGTNCGSAGRFEYAIDSFRVGGNLRLMSAGESVRFTSALGTGAVVHTFRIETPADKTFQGADPYFMAEVGMQFNFGHILFEFDGILYWDARDALQGDFGGGGGDQELFRSGGLRSIGIGLRGGWSEWRPPKKQGRIEVGTKTGRNSGF
jgi:hypothetical protein